MSNPFARSCMRWYKVFNIDTEPVPPFGLMQILDTQNDGAFQVKRPQQSSLDGLLINGPGQIPAGLGGQGHRSFPAIVAYDDGGDDAGSSPQPGQQWGSLAPNGVDNSWKLHPGQSGFLIASGGKSGKVMATAAGVVQSFAAISSSSTSSVQLFDGTKILAYPAHPAVSYTGGTPSAGNLVWTNASASIWLVGINGETLSTGTQYPCRLIGQDVNGVGIWAPFSTGRSKLENSTATPVSLTTSWANMGISVVLPSGQNWKATAQMTAQISTSATGANDEIQFRLFDGSVQWGRTITICNCFCDSVTFNDSGYVQGTGAGGVTLDLQGQIVTSAGSTGQMTIGSLIAETI